MASKTAQDFVPVQEVRNGTIIMKDGTLRGIVMASSTNFALKSEVEQNAIIGAFQTLLNTLDFSVQIVVQSRELDIRPYLKLLAGKENAQQSELMRLQTREYAAFVSQFVDETNIMRKYFYVVVPFARKFVVNTSSPISFLSKKKNPAGIDTSFEEKRVQLQQRIAVVSTGLAAAGIRTAPLNTEEVLELLYRSFNPGVFETPIHQEK